MGGGMTQLKKKSDEAFVIMKGSNIQDQFGVDQWLELKQNITSRDPTKRKEIFSGLHRVRWDLVIVAETHRRSWTPPAHKTPRYALGELLRDAMTQPMRAREGQKDYGDEG